MPRFAAVAELQVIIRTVREIPHRDLRLVAMAEEVVHVAHPPAVGDGIALKEHHRARLEDLRRHLERTSRTGRENRRHRKEFFQHTIHTIAFLPDLEL